MKKVRIVLMAVLFLLGFVISRPIIVKAAEDMMNMENNSMEMKGNAADMKKPEVAIEGDCPVCMMAGMHMEGKDEFMTEYNGKVYKFENEEHKKAFLADPEKYVQGLDAKYEEMEKNEGVENKEADPTPKADMPMPKPAY